MQKQAKTESNTEINRHKMTDKTTKFMYKQTSCFSLCSQTFTDESKIQEVNPPKTVAPPLQPQPLNKEWNIR